MINNNFNNTIYLQNNSDISNTFFRIFIVQFLNQFPIESIGFLKLSESSLN